MRKILAWFFLVSLFVGIHALDDNTVLEVFEEVFPPSDQTTLKGTGNKVIFIVVCYYFIPEGILKFNLLS